MILGLGADLVEIARIDEALVRFGERFAQRILSPAERLDMAGQRDAAAFLARRWAVKEAAAKALGTGIGADAGWQDMELAHDQGGAPVLQLRGPAERLARSRGVGRVHVSVSDERAYALAFVVLESVSS